VIPACYICEGCETRIPSTMIERQTRLGAAHFLEVPRVVCNNECCPSRGAELQRDPPFSDLARSP
jgi:hypothetical protein